jgi:hypothetical protein
MHYARQRFGSMRWFPTAALTLCAGLVMGCQGQVTPAGTGTGSTNGSGGSGGPGSGGTTGGACSASDPKMVLAPQRVMLLTKAQVINTVRYLIDAKEADDLVASKMFAITAESQKHFPPADGEEQNINETSILPLSNLSEHVGNYVTTNFTAVTKCATATDACATAYLNALAIKAYRRPLKTDEQMRFSTLYTTLKSQMVNGYAVSNTIQQATGFAVSALLMSPQLIWRWEIGSQASTAPPGIYLTDDELASQLSFFLTDQPPDDMVLMSAKAGMLRTNLSSHVSRIVQSSVSKAWLRKVMELYFLLNQLPLSPVDETKFPVDSGLLASMQTEAEMFLDHVLWGPNLQDLLLSRTTFVNTRLAETVYKVPAPAGAAEDKFVRLELPADQRVGILTNPAFLTARSRSDGQDLISRAKTIKPAFTCLIAPAPDLDKLGDAIASAAGQFDKQTGQEQSAARAAVQPCGACHALFDSYGLPLEFYDAIARYRTTYDYLDNKPIDGKTTLPAEVGGTTVKNAVELAEALASTPAFTNCLAKSMLQYAMTEIGVAVDLPSPGSATGCATADVVQKYQSSPSKTFTALVTAVTQSPAFVTRKPAQ